MNAPIALDLRKSRLYFRWLMLAASEAALLATVFVLAWQRNWPIDLPGFDYASVRLTHTLPTVRLVEVFAGVAVIAYLSAGWPHRERLTNGAGRLFTWALVLLPLAAALSTTWSLHPGLAVVQSVHMMLWAGFTLMIVCTDVSVGSIVAMFLAGLLAHSAVGFLQVSLQHFVGLGPKFGELPVTPQDTWASVVTAGPVRLLRAYGLSGHPNVLGGHLAVGVVLAWGILVTWPRVWRALIVPAWAAIWALLLLTFSRSAWLATVAGLLIALLLLVRGRLLERRIIASSGTLAVIALALTVWFAATFSPFLSGRFGAAAQPLETYSLNQRAEMIGVAIQLIATYPFSGVGAANYSVASEQVTPGHYPLNSIHNVPLLIASEQGVPGAVLFLIVCGCLIWRGWTRWRSRALTVWSALLAGALAALFVIMVVDSYLWTAPQGALLWALVMGCWLRQNSSPGGAHFGASGISETWRLH